jgi:hypothetical protein
VEVSRITARDSERALTSQFASEPGELRQKSSGTIWLKTEDPCVREEGGPRTNDQWQAGRHALEGQRTNETVVTGVAVLRLQNGSRWQ